MNKNVTSFNTELHIYEEQGWTIHPFTREQFDAEISFRLENHIYTFEEAKKALEYLDEFYKKQLTVEEAQEKVTAEFGHDEDDEER